MRTREFRFKIRDAPLIDLHFLLPSRVPFRILIVRGNRRAGRTAIVPKGWLRHTGLAPKGSLREKPAPLRKQEMPFAYILRSLKDGRYYYGSTSDLEQRLLAHNSGKVKSTKSRRPLVLHYREELTTTSEARQRERFFKSIAGYRWLRAKGVITGTQEGVSK